MAESNSIEEIKTRLEVQTVVKQELAGMLRQNSRRQLIQSILTAMCTVATIIVFIFYFTRPTKTDILVFKQIQRERMLLRAERDSMLKEKENLQRLQMRKKGF